MATSIGQKIRDLRREKGYTLEKLAELTESSKSYIWELENKDPPRPSAEKVARIAKALGVTSDYLVNEAEASPTEDVIDRAFFRKYQDMDPTTKKRFQELANLWGDKKE
ncbi:MAG: helix-turn-helix transcriptional regulator [Hyphomicrobium sp.]